MRPSRKSIGGTSAMSAAVHTATTPGSARAAAVSIADDVAVRVVRADDPHVKLVRKRDVAGEAAAAAHQRRVLQPLDRLADPLAVARIAAGGHRRASAAACGALTRPPVRARAGRRWRPGRGDIRRWWWRLPADRRRRPPPRPPRRTRRGPAPCPASSFSASAMRRGCGSAPPTPTRGSAITPFVDAVGHQRHAEREIAGAAVELVEAEARVRRQDRQPHLGQQFVLRAAPSS